MADGGALGAQSLGATHPRLRAAKANLAAKHSGMEKLRCFISIQLDQLRICVTWTPEQSSSFKGRRHIKLF